MAAADPYTDPKTGCLHNLLGITDPQRLQQIEAALVVEAERSLYDHPEHVDATLDSDHWQAIHRYLFRNVYPWAGEFRTIDIEKGGHTFHPVSRLHQAVAWCTGQLRRVALGPSLGRDDLAAALSPVLADLNEAHPFREGNGRTQRALITQAASRHGWTLDWSLVTAAENLDRSIASTNDPTAFVPMLRRVMRSRSHGGPTPLRPPT